MILSGERILDKPNESGSQVDKQNETFTKSGEVDKQSDTTTESGQVDKQSEL